jgi:NAD(P) transhydrogenase subunit alpha
MSGANSIHGVVLVGVILVSASANTTLSVILIFFAALLGTLNVVGGYVVTDRMLEMFKPKKDPNLVDYDEDGYEPISVEIERVVQNGAIEGTVDIVGANSTEFKEEK